MPHPNARGAYTLSQILHYSFSWLLISSPYVSWHSDVAVWFYVCGIKIVSLLVYTCTSKALFLLHRDCLNWSGSFIWESYFMTFGEGKKYTMWTEKKNKKILFRSNLLFYNKPNQNQFIGQTHITCSRNLTWWCWCIQTTQRTISK